jgi:NAD(P)-dependent dehydrogenase (short-subunit alcohol dehydrogenase family)
MKIEGSVALVTGANRGLGRALARALLDRGASVVYGAARDPRSVTDPGVTPVRLDITDPESIAALARQLPDVGLLINNAGISHGGSLLASPVDREQGTQVVGVHVGYIDTDMAAHITAPKNRPEDVAVRVLDGVGAGHEEILADELTRTVKGALSGDLRDLYAGLA